MNGPGCVKVASVAGFYAWLQEPVSDHAKEDARLLDLIRDSYGASHGVYGARRIFGDLREVGEVCGLHRVDLAVVVDLFARKVVGWSMKPSLSRELAMDALLMAVWRRKPAGRVVVHSDQGSQYGSDDFKRFCQAKNLELSMSRRANCWDNAVAESFFSSLKKERIRKRVYKTCDLARADIFEYIEVFHNRTRRHSHIGGGSPEAFETAAA